MTTVRKPKTIKKSVLISFLTVVIVIVGVVTYIKAMKDDNKLIENEPNSSEKESKNEEKKLKIVDLNSTTRPYAVMINNNHEAWPQSGLQEAYIVYEIITEGGITRMLALYKDINVEKIGSARSARHYFLDYALENDAIFCHFGWSPQAESDVKSLGINNINGMVDGSAYWRDSSLGRAYEHTVFTSTDKLKTSASKKGYLRDKNKDFLFNYSIDELDISNKEQAVKAETVKVKYSDYHTSSYLYNHDDKLYYRSMSGTANKDLVTGKQYTVKNIIVISVENYTIDSTGRQELENIGTGNGYYITNGTAVPIKWKKDSRSSQTVYSYLDGSEITLNDGNTYIQIQPKKQNLIIE